MSIRDELEALQKANDGILQVETAVQWAEKHPQSELYRSLEWDDAAAGHQFRCWQVRRLIKIHLINVDREPEVVSLSIDRIAPGGGYRRLDAVMQTVSLREIALADALAELERVRQRYEYLTELATIWRALDQVKIRRKSARLAAEAKGA